MFYAFASSYAFMPEQTKHDYMKPEIQTLPVATQNIHGFFSILSKWNSHFCSLLRHTFLQARACLHIKETTLSFSLSCGFGKQNVSWDVVGRTSGAELMLGHQYWQIKREAKWEMSRGQIRHSSRSRISLTACRPSTMACSAWPEAGNLLFRCAGVISTSWEIKLIFSVIFSNADFFDI